MFLTPIWAYVTYYIYIQHVLKNLELSRSHNNNNFDKYVLI